MNKRVKGVVSMGLLSLMMANVGYASSSTDIKLDDFSPKAQVYKSYVNVNDCTNPIIAGKYVVIFGNGGADMEATCPDHHPVMRNWQQKIGFGGLGAVSYGGGGASVRCCAVSYRWEPA